MESGPDCLCLCVINGKVVKGLKATVTVSVPQYGKVIKEIGWTCVT